MVTVSAHIMLLYTAVNVTSTPITDFKHTFFYTIMSLSKLSSVDTQKVSTRLQKAQATRAFSISSEFFSEHLVKLLNAHSNATGVPPEHILRPLLTTQIGTNASVKINDEWFEPSIFWFVIVARKGEKKTAALK